MGETQSLGQLQPVFKEPQRGVSLPPAHPVGVTSQSWRRTGSWLVAAVAGCQSLLCFSLLHFGPMGMVGGPPPLCHTGLRSTTGRAGDPAAHAMKAP